MARAMRRLLPVLLVFLVPLAGAQSQAGERAAAVPSVLSRLALQRGWQLQSSCKVADKGDVISTQAFHPDGWYPAKVPGGVLANLVADKVYPDPNYGMNLREIPGTEYRVGTLFANQPMPDDSPFKCSWWYRTEFAVPAGWSGRRLWLHFDGINYRANVWINGRQIARANPGDSPSGLDDLARGAVAAGTWRLFEFNVSDLLQPGQSNVLAVEVFPPTEFDLALNWVDWNPAPPDKNMGLWRDVYLTSSGPVTLRDPQAATEIDANEKNADVTLRIDVRNASSQPIRGHLRALIFPPSPGGYGGGIVSVQQDIELQGNESREVVFSPEQFAQLHLQDAKLWWPADLGPQDLYHGRFQFFPVGDGELEPSSDTVMYEFGIRQITSELTPEGHRLFKINGKNILIRGAGWASDLLLDSSDERIDQQLRYVRHMHLNAVRLEGKLETDHFFDEADRLGILVMAGWCCCDQWEKWERWTSADHIIARESLRSQIQRLRNHPSVFVWLNGSDNPPPANVEQEYIAVLKELNWPNPYLSSASGQHTTVTGASGVKMSGPYDWVPPAYWLADVDTVGGAFGFNTETSPGPAIPPVESLRRFLPPEHLWPIDSWWGYHAGGGNFKTVDIFSDAMNLRYGPAGNLDDYERKAQAMAYDGERAMFEAYRRNKYRSTGVIQWMLNNAWPSVIWHLYDWYLMPAGGYFGTRVANEPLHIQYSYDDGSVYVTNSLYRAFTGVRARAEVYDFDLRLRYSRQVRLDVPEDSSTLALMIPDSLDLTPVYFVRLQLQDAQGRELSRNFYWLSTRADVLDWEHSNYFTTPLEQQADYTILNDLGSVDLRLSGATSARPGDEVTRVVVENPSRRLAFMVHLRLTDAAGQDVLPILWDDNYFSLMPGERREISAHYDPALLHGAPVVKVEGWNVVPRSVRGQSPASVKPAQ